ncbi:tape measure protein [Leptospira alexanderi]|uniref:tape measure protein n=1 Tax=Leptospira alexanderi TaxID=100053 RepID=UPI000990F51F|nr:tape measure protein [Leptospira alexanderi]
MSSAGVLGNLSFKIDSEGVDEVHADLSYLNQTIGSLVSRFGSLLSQIGGTSESTTTLAKTTNSLTNEFESFNRMPDSVGATSDQIQAMSAYLGMADDELSKLISKTKNDFKLAEEFEKTARAAGMTDEEILKIVEHSKSLKSNPPLPPKIFAPTVEQIQAMSKSLGITESQLNRLISKTKNDFKLADEFEKTARAAGFADREIQSISNHIEQSKIKTVGWMSLLKGLSSLGLAASLGGLFGSALDQAGQLEKFETVLTTTLGTSNLAKAAMADIKDFAKTTPYEMTEMTGAYVKFANRGIIPTMELMTRFGDIAASQGKGFDQFTEAVLDATTGEFERMKEFGIRMSSAGSKVMIQFKDFKKSVDKTPESIKNALLELGKLKGVQGGMEALSKTWGGLVSNLKDGFNQTISIAGVFIATILKPVLEFFTDGERGAMRLRFAVASLAIAIGVGLVAAGNAWLATLDAIAIAKIAAFGELIAIAAAVAVSLTAVYLALEDIFIFFEHGAEGSDTYFADLLKWFGLTDSELSDLHKSFQDFKIALSEIWESISAFAESDTGKTIKKILLIVAGVAAAIAFLPATMAFGLTALAVVFYTKWNSITAWFKSAWDKTLDFLLDSAAFTAKLLIVYLFPVSALYLFRDEFGRAFDWIWNKLQSIPFLKPLLDQLVALKYLAKDIFNSILDSINVGLNSLFNFDELKSYFIKIINDLIAQINSSFSSNSFLSRVFPQIPLIEARRFGGPVESGQPYIVGEDGPELKIFDKPGSIIPNHDLRSVFGTNSNSQPAIQPTIQFHVGSINVSGEKTAATVASDVWSEIKRIVKENENEIRISLGLAPA